MKEKARVILKLTELLNHRIEEAKNAIAAAKESRDSETKSSMGDKYETGREMVQIEMGKHQDQLNKSIKLKSVVSQIDPKKELSEVKFGSLVSTNHGKYMLCVGLGVVEVDKEKYFAISLASPVGKLLEGKKCNEGIVFQGRTITIVEIK